MTTMDDLDIDKNSIYNLLAWIFLPNMISKFILSIIYKLFGTAAPQKKQRHQNMVYAAVILSYLIYSVGTTYIDLGDNHFNTLGLTASATNKEVSSAYRKLSVQYHPDRNANANPEIYLKMNAAHEVLKDAKRRFVYDRYGDLNSCQHCKTQHDYFENYMTFKFTVFYFGFVVAMGVFMGIQKPYAMFWRFFSVLAMVTTELIFVTNGSPDWFLGDLTTAQKISFLHSSFVWISVALGHLGPTLEYFIEGPKFISKLEDRLDTIESTLDTALMESQFVLNSKLKNVPLSEKKTLVNEMNLKLKEERAYYAQQAQYRQ
eukprot:NODE_15_length_50561_cov_0.608081.p20 type:complete len:317 gc:universal NODE_15_length_50561_cov_0.608081:30340-31290(+)